MKHCEGNRGHKYTHYYRIRLEGGELIAGNKEGKGLNCSFKLFGNLNFEQFALLKDYF